MLKAIMSLLIMAAALITPPRAALAACDYSKIPVFAAAYRNDLNAIQQGKFTLRDLNQKYPDGACQGWAPIIIAAAEGHAEMVKLLIAKGVDVNAVNAYGRTALMFASKYGFLEIVRALLNAGADPNIRPKEGPPAIIAAGYDGRAKEIWELLLHGAKIASSDCKTQADIDSCARIAIAISVFQSDFARSTNLIKLFCIRKTEHQQSVCNILTLNDCFKRHPEANRDHFVDYWLDSKDAPILDNDICVKSR